MKTVSAEIPISEIYLNESIYPREKIDHKRIAVFEENLRDGFVFEPIVVQAWPDKGNAVKKDKYRILDGVHRWSMYKKTGAFEIIADLRATAVFGLELKIFRLHQLGIPQDRSARRLGVPQQTISRYLLQMPQVAKGVNSDLRVTFTLKGRNQVIERFSVPQVAQKHGCPEFLVWSQALVNADDFGRFKALQWKIRTWDVVHIQGCD